MAAIETTSDSLLALDIGAITTRALFFDVVDGQYHFIAAGSAPTTASAPFHNVMEGVHMALDELRAITGRPLLGHDQNLIIPSTPAGEGVDALSVVLSAGAPIRTIIMGLLDDVSIASARHLLQSSYVQVVETFTLSDRRKLEDRLDAILRLRPDLIVIVGGTEKGASLSVRRMLDPLRLALPLIPEMQRPHLLYAGNSALQEEIQTIFKDVAPVHVAPNVRPSLSTEDLEGAQIVLSNAVTHLRIQRMGGVETLHTWAGGGVFPAASAYGRMIRFLSQEDTTKGVLGVDVGVSATTVSAAFQGHLYAGVYPALGLGPQLAGLLSQDPYEKLAPWLSANLTPEYVRAYAFNKSLYPGIVPITEEDAAIEQAIATYALRQAAILSAQNIASRQKMNTGQTSGGALLPQVEPIIATGGPFTHTNNPGRVLLTLLDGIQPLGITTILLDRYNLTTLLGAAASTNPVLAIQAMTSNIFTRLALVVSPVSNARLNTPILRVHLRDNESGEESHLDVKSGNLVVLPLSPGRRAALRLQPLYRADIGLGPGRKAAYEVAGSLLGIVIDARGRPYRPHKDPARRDEIYKKWLWNLGH
ncbi:MAG: glutamate mutase L [Anaerolineales bacterium]